MSPCRHAGSELLGDCLERTQALVPSPEGSGVQGGAEAQVGGQAAESLLEPSSPAPPQGLPGRPCLKHPCLFSSDTSHQLSFASPGLPVGGLPSPGGWEPPGQEHCPLVYRHRPRAGRTGPGKGGAGSVGGPVGERWGAPGSAWHHALGRLRGGRVRRGGAAHTPCNWCTAGKELGPRSPEKPTCPSLGSPGRPAGTGEALRPFLWDWRLSDLEWQLHLGHSCQARRGSVSVGRKAGRV